jgi:glycosidase
MITRKYPAWLDAAVFYEIYPQSFCDSNADGIGDIPGIISKLDYIKSLGATAIWLNPCFESPFLDAGYDVSDYYKVAPRYGTNEDLVRLFNEARTRGIRILLDLVPGHTSFEHAWFKESCKHERNQYSDYYIWTDSGWTWDVPGFRLINGYAERNGSYITNFFYSQPALNFGFANPDPRYPWQQPVDAPGPQAVRQEIKSIMQYWLDLGASGFRVDMAASLVKADPDHKVLSQWWREIRAWLDQDYPDAVMVSEWSYPIEALNAGFHMDFYIHFRTRGYTSLFRKPYAREMSGGDRYAWSFFDRSGHGNIRQFLDEYTMHYEATRENGFICFPTGNHDIHPRLSQGRDIQDLELVYLFLMTMPGVPYIYYGDEIGMRSINGLPSKEGGFERTCARTPMQWDDSPNAGFSTANAKALYLPVDNSPDRPTVATQETDQWSLLQRVRKLVALRKNHPALHANAHFEPVFAEAGRCPFVYRRSSVGEEVLVAVNPSELTVEVALPVGSLTREPVTLYGTAGALTLKEGEWILTLPPISGGAYRLQ